MNREMKMSKSTSLSSIIIREFNSHSNKNQAKNLTRFFKCELGDYGYGDKFLGIKVPQTRSLVNKYKNNILIKDLVVLIKSPIHEIRLFALLSLIEISKRSEEDLSRTVKFYFEYISYVNNWDLVDLSAPHILGKYYLNSSHIKLIQMSKSKNLWIKRISILATFAFIRTNQFKTTIRISEILIHDDHDLIHKAVGWMLREMGKRDTNTLRIFLDKYAHKMPRTMLRYSIEKFPLNIRLKYMNA